MEIIEQDLKFEQWEVAIGRLILACSRVEYELIRLYVKYLPDRDYHKDSYESRFDKSIGVARSKLDCGERIASALVLMKKVAHYRHMVAHNPIHYSLETDNWYIFDLKSNKNSICLDELLELAKNIHKHSIALSADLRLNV